MLRNTHCYSNWGAAMRNPNENERLRAEFFRQYGKPLERVRGVRAARGGSIHQLYRDSDGKLIRLRTSVDGVLVTKAIGPTRTTLTRRSCSKAPKTLSASPSQDRAEQPKGYASHFERDSQNPLGFGIGIELV